MAVKKEASIAIIGGIAAGVLIAVAIVLTTRANKGASDPIPTPMISPTVTVQQNEKEELFTINSPKNGISTKNEEITIKGTAPKSSTIVLQSPANEVLEKTTSKSFEIPFPIAMGENVISVTFYSEGEVVEKSLTIYRFEDA